MKQTNAKRYGLKTALAKLGIIDAPVTVEALVKVLKKNQKPTAGWAAWVLGQVGTDEVVGELEAISLARSNNDTALWAVWALGEVGSQRAIATLLNALKHGEPEVRWRAAATLGKNRVLEAVPALIETLKNDKDGYVRGKAAAALGNIGSESAVSALVEGIFDEDLYTSAQTVEALGKIGTELAVKGLLTALQHPDSQVRGEAVFALGEVGDRGIDGIAAALEDKDIFVRGRAAKALGELGAERAIAPLDRCLRVEPGYYVRWNIAEALGRIGTDKAVKALEFALEDPEPAVQQRAVKSLKQIDSETARAALEKGLSSFAPEVREKMELLLRLEPLPESTTETTGNLPQIWITSFSEAAEYIAEKRDSLKYLISIGTPGTPLPVGFDSVPHRLRLEFSDIDEPVSEPDMIMPSPGDVLKIVEFASLVARKDGDVLVHCHAGVSRSTAAALTVWAVLLGAEESSQELDVRAMSNVLAATPLARPNRWLVELADEILGREGKLVEIVEFMVYS
jgi:HEAT repeat protein